MRKVIDIRKNKPNPNQYIPDGLVLLAMDYYGESDPQCAWDRLIGDVLREHVRGDEEVDKVSSGIRIVEWADHFREHFKPST